MGSSKKHKEKDKDRDEKRHKHKEKDRDKEKKHKHRRHRSRSRSKERQDKHDKHVDKHDRDSARDSSRKKRTRSPSPSEDGARARRRSPDRGSSSKGGGKTVESLSIEETNKIRAKLGLPPLDDGKSSAKKDKGPNISTAEAALQFKEKETTLEDGDVHKPAVNLREEKKAKEIKQKLALIKEKRQMNKKLKKVKTIGEQEEDDDTYAWIERSRKLQQEKEKAEKKAKMLAEMDEEFGIGSLVQDQMKREREEMYTAQHISGMRVEHSKEAFKEGKQVILTLKDSGVLGEEDDVLMNYNLLDDERTAKNVELRKKKPAYKAYDEPEYDEFGVFKPRAILDKYDEEIQGAQITSFTLDGAGGASTDEEVRLQRIRANLQRQAVTLQTRAPQIASEYYTHQEMETFKKPRRKRKIRRKLRGKFTVDELMPDKKSKAQDHGSRRDRHELDDVEYDPASAGGLTENGNGVAQGAADMEVDLPSIDQGNIQGPTNSYDDYLGPAIDDEAENELHNVLNKARKLKLKKERKKHTPSADQKVAEQLSQIPDEPTSPQASGSGLEFSAASSIVLNSTSEFCRKLGDIPSYGASGNREDDVEDEAMAYEEEGKEYEPGMGEEEEGVQAWSTVNLDKGSESEEEDEQVPVLEEEPTVQVGVAGALQLAVNKGYLMSETSQPKKGASLQRDILESQNFMVEEKNYNDIDAKYSKHDRFRGPITDFRDKDKYVPNVKLEYIDDQGRHLNQKEAFRQLSHRFHGKGSGKMKTEKRLKKWQEEEAMKKMSSTDTPLGTVAMMQEKQKQMQMPYVMLSGGSKALSTNSITK